MTGHDVRVLQDFLTRAGFPTTIDGQFGSITSTHVISFQRAHQLKADGVVTWTVSGAASRGRGGGAEDDRRSGPGR